MANIYNQGVFRSGGTPDPLVPQPLSADIIQELPRASAALSLMNRTTLSSKTQRMPVLDVLPVAYWVGGDTGMKQTSQQQWKNVIMVVEELACIVPIPEAYLDDADVPLWSQVQPRLTEAIGQLIDNAVLWGVNKPATWGESVFVGATKSGHWTIQGTGTDLGVDVATLGQQMAQSGYTVNGFAAMPGISWLLTGMRSAQGVPIYQPDMTTRPGGSLYGYPMGEINNGSWINPTTGALLLAGDFSKSIIGVRNDISFKMFTEGVISNDAGAVILNLMQQDSVAMRVTMRLAYATVNPVTIMQPGSAITARWPFGAVLGVGTTPPAGGAISVVSTYPGGTLLSAEGAVIEDEDEMEQRHAQEREEAEQRRVAAKEGAERTKAVEASRETGGDDKEAEREPAHRRGGRSS